MSTEGILKAATELLDGAAPAEMSMSELADRCGISRSTLYRRVGSKEELLAILRDRGHEAPETADARDRILEATAELVGRRGDLTATVDEISDEAGVSKVTIFRLFDDKESLLRAFAESVLPRDDVARTMRVESLSLRERLEEVAETMLSTLREYPGLVGTQFLTSKTSPGLEPVQRSGARARELFIEVFREAIDDGELVPESPALMMSYFVGLAVMPPGLRGHLDEPFELDVRRESRRVADMFLEEFGAQRDWYE